MSTTPNPPIQNRYEFELFFDVTNGNPNGDPDAANLPRIDPEDMHGLVSDVALKRRIRNYIEVAKGNENGYKIFIQHSTNLNRFIAEAYESRNESIPDKATKEQVHNAKEWMCKEFYDVRTFGAVMSTGANAGQVRGPIQISFSRSVEPIVPMDISITRSSVADKASNAKTAGDYKKWEDEQPENELRTFGRKTLVPYGLYRAQGFISAHFAEQTGFSNDDLSLFWDALQSLFEHDRSASKGKMSAQALYVFKHEGTDSDHGQRVKQAKLGCAPAHKLFECVQVSKKEGVEVARQFTDYQISVDETKIPAGVSYEQKF